MSLGFGPKLFLLPFFPVNSHVNHSHLYKLPILRKIDMLSYHMDDTAVQIATDGRQVWLTVALLRLPLSFPFEETLLKRSGLQILLLTRACERLVEPRHTFRLASSVRFYPSSATNWIRCRLFSIPKTFFTCILGQNVKLKMEIFFRLSMADYYHLGISSEI